MPHALCGAPPRALVQVVLCVRGALSLLAACAAVGCWLLLLALLLLLSRLCLSLGAPGAGEGRHRISSQVALY